MLKDDRQPGALGDPPRTPLWITAALAGADVSRNNPDGGNITSLDPRCPCVSGGAQREPRGLRVRERGPVALWVAPGGTSKFQDEGQTVCGSPADMQGRRLGEVGIQLRTLCHQTLGSWDYLFFVVIGFVIFAAGTVSAWVMGVIMVLYERYIKKKEEQLDPEDEEELGDRRDHGNGNLKMSHTV
ncbi:uncharacterized protein [Notothenia coriiceps]|uniref:Uncharacterized protein n=1 Tax=Notothenia coriiceps TaxID=8208 RepID=A0A6I9Q6I6_9TELE|nr:PREDICTED: leucine-rich repeat-containing protein 52 [Notothenia coriiceps]